MAFLELEISSLRLIGLIIGIFLSIWILLRLRHFSKSRFDIWWVASISFALICISLVPSLLNFPSEILNLKEVVGGRIIVTLMASVGLLFFLFFKEQYKNSKMRIHFDLLVRQFALNAVKEKKLGKNFSTDIAVIIPALNEAENLDVLLPKIPKDLFEKKIIPIVIDDGSSDETRNICEKYEVLCVANPFNRGGGASLRLGYDVAVLLGARSVVTMDADGQHDPADLAPLLKPILKENADIVIGSRVLGSHERDSWFRWFGIHVFGFLIHFLMGQRITDCSSGYRVFKVDSIKKLRLHQDQYHTAELIIEALKQHLKVTEVPVNIQKRHFGKSKKGPNFYYGLNFLRSIIKAWLR